VTSNRRQTTSCSANKAAYRDIVLRCCLLNNIHDWQIEGSIGYYLYDVILATGKPEYFERMIIDRFLSRRCSDRFFYQLASIIYCYANNGSEPAKNALRAKYNYFASKKGRLFKNPHIDEGLQWDEVVVHLLYIDGFAAFKRYALDIGEIRCKNPRNMKAYDDWYQCRAVNKFGEKRINNFLSSMYEKSDAIRALVDTIKSSKLAYKQEWERKEQEPFTIPDLIKAASKAAADKNPHFKMHKLLKRRLTFTSKASDKELLELAHAALNEENETVKALLLNQFRYKTFPLDITSLLQYAKSDNELLAETSIDRLKEFKDNRIYDLAVQLLKTKGLKSFALALFINNYKKSDEEIICMAIKKSTNIPHHVQQDMSSIYRHHRSASVFQALFSVYQKGNCAFCRCKIVKAMEHCGVLPDEILKECLYDSYDDTRKYAKRLIKKRGDK